MPTGKYKKPPITEAIVEIRFSSSVPQRALHRFLRSIAKRYPAVEQTYEISAHFQVSPDRNEPEVKPEQKLSGYKLTGNDAADIIILGLDRIGTIRLAPYNGWECLFERTKENYETLKKVCGYRRIIRVATRYTNRIDIPIEPGVLIKTDDYLLIEPRVPSLIRYLNHFFTNFVGVVPEIEGQVIVQSGTVVSPLIDHASLLLDIDLFREQNLPNRDEDLWDLFSELRMRKNALFESFVTDKSRELFSGG